MSKKPVNKKTVVCLETGESFNSLREAAGAIGLSYQNISRSAKTGCATGGLHFYFAGEEKPEKAFFIASDRRGRGKKRPVICLETSEHFESVHAVKKILGCSGGGVWKALNKGYSIHGLHYYYADEPKPDDLFFEHKRGGYKRSKPIVCLETGEVFESADDVANSIGCKPAYITSSIREGFPVKGFHFDMWGGGGRETRSV